MIGRGTLLWLALAIVAGAGLFHVSYRVQSLEEDLTQVNRDILREQETIHLLARRVELPQRADAACRVDPPPPGIGAARGQARWCASRTCRCGCRR